MSSSFNPHLIPPLAGSYYYFPHFSDEQTETPRGSITGLRLQGSEIVGMPYNPPASGSPARVFTGVETFELWKKKKKKQAEEI